MFEHYGISFEDFLFLHHSMPIYFFSSGELSKAMEAAGCSEIEELRGINLPRSSLIGRRTIQSSIDLGAFTV
jgi:hypothetical protein